jgi:hypothetical protein
MPFDIPTDEVSKLLIEKTALLMDDLEKKSNLKIANYKATGKVEYREYSPKKSKPLIDEIDKVLAKHYGFTEEELDFIINYDIKYRMGSELEGGLSNLEMPHTKTQSTQRHKGIKKIKN